MSVLNFVQKFLANRKGLSTYEKKLRLFLTDGKLSQEEKKELELIAQDFDLKKEDLTKIAKTGFQGAFSVITEDRRITEDEKKALETILNYFGLKEADVKFDQKNFNKYYSLALIDKGVLPVIAPNDHDLTVLFKEGENIHCIVPSTLRKLKKITTRVRYGGFAASTKIVGGIRYRAGSYKVHTDSHDLLAIEDTGRLYLTNQRIGFIGSKKQFSLDYKKVHSFELRPDGLYIFKEGKEIPYIITIDDDYDLPLSIISFILNK